MICHNPPPGCTPERLAAVVGYCDDTHGCPVCTSATWWDMVDGRSCCRCDWSEPQTVPSRVPSAERFAELIAEGQDLRRRFDRDSAGMRVLTAEDRARVSR